MTQRPAQRPGQPAGARAAAARQPDEQLRAAGAGILPATGRASQTTTVHTGAAGAEQARLRVLEALAQLLGSRTVPGGPLVLHLTDRRTSSARSGVGRRPPALFIRRALVDDSDPLVLRGELAHELGHLLDPRRWRDVLVGSLACGIPGGLATCLFVAELAAPWLLRGGPRWIAPALFGCALLSFAIMLASYRAIRHRAEYRADAIAVELATAAVVRAWLISMQASEQRHGRRPWLATLTHPRTEARLARLPS